MGIQIQKLDHETRKLFRKGEFGLEKESLRVTEEGNLSHTSHPFLNDAKIDRDFCENQVEMITGVQYSTEDVYEELASIHRRVVLTLSELDSGAEYLWPFSNPPYVLGEKDIPIAAFEGELSQKQRYREYLAKKYGKKKMLFSGIHFNFSFPEALLKADFHQQTLADFQDYKNRLYLDLAGKVLEYSWLIVYLTAASPVFDGSYVKTDSLDESIVSRYSSPRCSEIGYWNQFLPVLDFTTLEGYINSIQSYVDDGQLQAASELYYPVRLKPRGLNTLENLKEKGINHIELRMFDLNPLSDIGIDPRDLEFVFLLLTYLAVCPSKTVVASEQIVAIRNMKNAARLDDEQIRIEMDWNTTKPVKQAALDVLEEMEKVLTECFPDEQVKHCLSNQRRKIEHPEARYANRIVEEYKDQYVKAGMKLIKQRTEDLKKR